jgi:hypothetical protein
MGAKFTLQNLKDDLDAKYGAVELEGFPGEGGIIRLMPMLRHTEQRRDEITAVMQRHAAEGKARKAAAAPGQEDELEDGEGVDLNKSVHQIEELLTLVLERKSDIDRIKQGFGEDGQALIALWETFQESTQPGEASPSES